MYFTTGDRCRAKPMLCTYCAPVQVQAIRQLLPCVTCSGSGAPRARDLNRPSSERGVGHLKVLGSALGEVASTTNRPGGHGNEEKNEVPHRICGGLSPMCMCKRPHVTDHALVFISTGCYGRLSRVSGARTARAPGPKGHGPRLAPNSAVSRASSCPIEGLDPSPFDAPSRGLVGSYCAALGTNYPPIGGR
jgi:hypothetical protein